MKKIVVAIFLIVTIPVVVMAKGPIIYGGYLPLAGGTLSGPLAVEGSITSTALDGSRKLGLGFNTFYTPIVGTWNLLFLQYGSVVNTVLDLNGVLYAPRIEKAIYVYGGTPTAASCGSGSPSAETGSTNLKGAITVGATGTGCTITFIPQFTNAPACNVMGATGVVTGATASATTLTVTGTAGRIMWWCASLGE